MICMTEESIHGCFENAHFLNPGTWNSSRSRPLALTPGVGRASASASIDLDGGFSPSAVRGCTLSLVCGSVHLHWERDASAHRCTKSAGHSGTLSMGSQSNVYCRPFGGDRGSHPLSLFPACRICATGMAGGSFVCGLRRGALSAWPIWGQL